MSFVEFDITQVWPRGPVQYGSGTLVALVVLLTWRLHRGLDGFFSPLNSLELPSVTDRLLVNSNNMLPQTWYPQIQIFPL